MNTGESSSTKAARHRVGPLCSLRQKFPHSQSVSLSNSLSVSYLAIPVPRPTDSLSRARPDQIGYPRRPATDSSRGFRGQRNAKESGEGHRERRWADRAQQPSQRDAHKPGAGAQIAARIAARIAAQIAARIARFVAARRRGATRPSQRRHAARQCGIDLWSRDGEKRGVSEV